MVDGRQQAEWGRIASLMAHVTNLLCGAGTCEPEDLMPSHDTKERSGPIGNMRECVTFLRRMQG